VLSVRSRATPHSPTLRSLPCMCRLGHEQSSRTARRRARQKSPPGCSVAWEPEAHPRCPYPARVSARDELERSTAAVPRFHRRFHVLQVSAGTDALAECSTYLRPIARRAVLSDTRRYKPQHLLAPYQQRSRQEAGCLPAYRGSSVGASLTARPPFSRFQMREPFSDLGVRRDCLSVARRLRRGASRGRARLLGRGRGG
jgi:hypothetical protein